MVAGTRCSAAGDAELVAGAAGVELGDRCQDGQRDDRRGAVPSEQ
jgi:hypothetical protein